MSQLGLKPLFCSLDPPAHAKSDFKFFFFLINLFYFWLHWVFIALRGLSLVTVSNYSWLRCAGFSL